KTGWWQAPQRRTWWWAWRWPRATWPQAQTTSYRGAAPERDPDRHQPRTRATTLRTPGPRPIRRSKGKGLPPPRRDPGGALPGQAGPQLLEPLPAVLHEQRRLPPQVAVVAVPAQRRPLGGELLRLL